jgi:predicted SprT family Zn-dependent metalloprotease
MAVKGSCDLSFAAQTVEAWSRQFDVWSRVCEVVGREQKVASGKLLEQIAQVPVVRSRSTTTLGCYVSRSGTPCCIRLQFDQEPELLVQTLLHEVAHLIDHLVSFPGRPYRGAHRSGWTFWAIALGISPCRTGNSESLAQQHQQRKKLVAVCSGCGELFYRVRRLNRNRTYIHKQCGSPLKPV